MPGMLQEPRSVSGLKSGLSAWAKHCSKYYQKWGLTITGFVIDGEAPDWIQTDWTVTHRSVRME